MTGYEYTHHPYYPEFIYFVSPFVDFAINIPDVSTYEKTRRQRSTTTKSRKLTNDENGAKRKSKNKRKTEISEDELSETDTEKQTSEHKTFFFYVH